MSKLLQVYEQDLTELQQTLRDLAEHHAKITTARERTQWRRVQQIIGNVLWNYGPHTDIEVFPIDEDDTPDAM